MNYLLHLFNKARDSKFFLYILNIVLGYSIPFNRPHRIKITEIHDNGVSVRLPFRRKNLNHLKGIHACALATTAEYASGISLLLAIGTDYRLIMKNMHVTYYYQAKMDVITSVKYDLKNLTENVLSHLKAGEAVLLNNTVEVYDLMTNHICTATIEWQLKNWKNVAVK
jgi:acyl-coenzyme A thioesterase PaaI-like protein